MQFMSDSNAKLGRRNHWGKWIIRRRRFLGYMRLSDLATSIGCSYAAIYQWTHAENPPAGMQMGYDAKLISALLTTRMMLFNHYAFVAPEDAPIVGPDSNEGMLANRRRTSKQLPPGELEEAA